MTKSLIGSEKSADQAWDFLSSWFVIGGFYRAARSRPISAKRLVKPLTGIPQPRRNPVNRDVNATLHPLVALAGAVAAHQFHLQVV